jgi:hypothetical protein
MHASKIGDSPLFATVGALAAVWLITVVGLSLTIKREYLYTFVSLQTGYSFSQSYFLDNEGNDARRVTILYRNERHWQAIRDRVRQWVLSAYATWQALMPAFFTADLQARIPDDFMPAQAVQDLNAQSRDGRRPTVQNMGLLRRVSHAAPAVVASELDGGARRPSQLPIPPSVTTSSAAILPASDPTGPTASAAIVKPRASTGAATASSARDEYDPPLKPHDWPDAADEDEFQTLPEELPCEERRTPDRGPLSRQPLLCT